MLIIWIVNISLKTNSGAATLFSCKFRSPIDFTVIAMYFALNNNTPDATNNAQQYTNLDLSFSNNNSTYLDIDAKFQLINKQTNECIIIPGKEATGSSVGVFVSHVERFSEADKKGLKVSLLLPARNSVYSYIERAEMS